MAALPPRPPAKPKPPAGPPKPPPAQRWRLLRDAVSCFREKGKPIVYGHKGDIVREIRRNGEVLTVEGPDGNRYSLRIENAIQL